MSFLKTPDLPESFTKLISNYLQWFDRAFNFSDYPTKVRLIYVGGEILIWGFPYFWPKAFTQIIFFFHQIVAKKLNSISFLNFAYLNSDFALTLGYLNSAWTTRPTGLISYVALQIKRMNMLKTMLRE